MIRPLRRQHRWMFATLFIVLVLAAVLAHRHPAPSNRMESLPPTIRGGQP